MQRWKLWKQKLWIDDIGKYLFSNPKTITGVAGFETPDHIAVKEASRSKKWKPWKIGHAWGKPWGSAWFRMRFSVPKDFAGKSVALRLDTGGEAALFENGIPMQGIDNFHSEYRLLKRAKGGEKFDFLVEASIPRPWDAVKKSVLSRAEVCTVNHEVWDCYHTLKFLREMAETMPEDSPRRLRIVNALDRAVIAFDYEKTDEVTLKKSGGP